MLIMSAPELIRVHAKCTSFKELSVLSKIFRLKQKPTEIKAWCKERKVNWNSGY